MKVKECVKTSEYNVNASKFLLEMDDGCTVEVAGLVYPEDMVICMSCQVGCKHRCTFCANRFTPFVRNLSESEICNAVKMILELFPKKETVLDFSGIGDCSDNWEAVRNACVSLKNDNTIQRYSFTSVSPKAWCTAVLQEMKHDIVAPSKIMISLHGFDAASRSFIIPHAEDPAEAAAWWSLLKRDGVKIVMNYVLYSENVGQIDELIKYINDYADWIDVLRISPFNSVQNSPLTPLRKDEIEAAFEKVSQGIPQGISPVLFQPIGINHGFACGQMKARRENCDR
jgi:23S rRNA (adenine2503-C2)-methyltransferase